MQTNEVDMKGSWLRALPHFKGKYRLARILYSNFIETAGELCIPHFDGLQLYVPNIKEAIGFELWVDGIYEQDFIDFLCSKIPLNGCFLDVGANIGSICIPVAKRRPDVNVIAIEASSTVYSYLEKNIAQNHLANITIQRAAVSDKSNQLLKFYSPSDLYGKGSLKSVFTDKFEEVESITVDQLNRSLVKPIDVIKVDVEGFELSVFQGARETLEKGISILFEFADWAEAQAYGKGAEGKAQLYLQKHGYTLYNCDSGSLKYKLESPVKTGFHMLYCEKGK